MLRKTLSQMRQKFGVLLADGIPQKQPDGRWQLYDDVRQEIYGHDNLVSTTGYRHRVEEACEFLQGKSREWLESLRHEMETAATKLHFEKAAELRDVISALEGTLKRTRKFERDQTLLRSDHEALTTLQKELKLSGLPQHMECFDISHISGTFVVASMVHFTEGRPDKDQYRRFKIKSFIGNDDYRAMEEVVGRRYRRLAQENKPLPDLVVIDGGRGQIAAALKAFIAIDVEPPALIGLAKKHETIIFANEREPLNLSINDPGLNLLQRLRDEAHRFANTYNADLRSKKLRESILDDFPGLGPKRRGALLAHFGSIDKLRQASALDISEAEGIGPKFATELHAYLHSEKKRTRKDFNP
jgi:excinuclease ABC subunit C